jgi:hypothetical protein
MQMGSGLPSMMVAIAFLVASEHAQAATLARDLLNDCQSLERGKRGYGNHIQIPKTSASLVCWGYMEAMQDLSVWIDEGGQRIIGSCAPEGTTLLVLIHSFVMYARSHPNQLQDNAALAIMRAFQEAFPCGQAVAPPR